MLKKQSKGLGAYQPTKLKKKKAKKIIKKLKKVKKVKKA